VEYGDGSSTMGSGSQTYGLTGVFCATDEAASRRCLRCVKPDAMLEPAVIPRLTYAPYFDSAKLPWRCGHVS